MLQLHARIRENELKTQQVLQNHSGLFDHPLILNAQVRFKDIKEVSRKSCSVNSTVLGSPGGSRKTKLR